MEGATLIDAVISYTDNVSPLDGDNANRRARILHYIQQTVNEVWFYRRWPFAYKSDTVTVDAAANSGELPGDFHQITKHGGVFDSDGHMLQEVPFAALLEQRRLFSTDTTKPDQYSIFGNVTNTGGTFRLLQTLTVAGATTFNIDYYRTPPTIADEDTASGLPDVPFEYHHSVLLPGVVSKTRRSKGDTRNFEALYKEGLSFMVANEVPLQRAVTKMPRSIVGMW